MQIMHSHKCAPVWPQEFVAGRTFEIVWLRLESTTYVIQFPVLCRCAFLTNHSQNWYTTTAYIYH